MTGKYNIGDKPVHRWRKLLSVLILSLLIFGGIVYLVLQQA